MFFRQIIDPLLSQHSYLIGCESAKEAILFEPERDIDRYLKLAERNGYKIVGTAETHIHADFLSGLRQLAESGVKVYASDEGGRDWQYEWLKMGNYEHQLLCDGDNFSVGNVSFKVLHTPGHTPEHLSYIVTERKNGVEAQLGMLTGDFVFVGDVGRPDLLETAAGYEGSAESAAGELFESIQKFKKLPPDLMVWPSHGAGSACGKSLGASPMSTVEQELKFNRSILAATNKQSFVDYILAGQPEPPYYFARMKRDNREGPAVLKKLPTPKNISPEEIEKLSRTENTIVIDGRDWLEFQAGHLKGTLFAPLDRYFILVTGSYIEPGTQIGLIIDEDLLNQTISALSRIGHDNVTAYITPEQFAESTNKEKQLDTIKEITVSELKELIPDLEGRILDVRNSSELMETGQIEGAQNVAFTRLLLQHGEIPKDGTVYVYCRSGNRSEYACSFLKNAGFKVTHVAGGVVAWLGSGFKLVPMMQAQLEK